MVMLVLQLAAGPRSSDLVVELADRLRVRREHADVAILREPKLEPRHGVSGEHGREADVAAGEEKPAEAVGGAHMWGAWWWCGLASPELGDGSEGATEASADAGMVPVPVAATMAGSACCSSHWTVSPSDLWPSSLVSWKIRAAQSAGIRIRRPRPSTLVWRSLLELRLGARATLRSPAGTATCSCCSLPPPPPSCCGGWWIWICRW